MTIEFEIIEYIKKSKHNLVQGQSILRALNHWDAELVKDAIAQMVLQNKLIITKGAYSMKMYSLSLELEGVKEIVYSMQDLIKEYGTHGIPLVLETYAETLNDENRHKIFKMAAHLRSALLAVKEVI